MNLDVLGWSPVLACYLDEVEAPDAWPGRVVRVERGTCQVRTEDGAVEALWRGPLDVPGERPVARLAVGDWCAVVTRADRHLVGAVLPRQTRIARAVESGDRAEQLLAVNVDVAFIVTGLDGDWSLRRIERYLALARAGGVRPVVVLNKADRCDDVAARCAEAERVSPGAAVLPTSATRGEGVDAVAAELQPHRTGVFLGSSGAGKSTLINRLLGRARQRTADVRAFDDRGRHTTTHRELIVLDRGGVVIDSPGLRAVGVVAEEDDLAAVFPEVVALAAGCRFDDCRHESEPGCAVQAAVQAGELPGGRYESFLRLSREAEAAGRRRDTYAQRRHERQTIGHYKRWAREAQRLKGKD